MHGTRRIFMIILRSISAKFALVFLVMSFFPFYVNGGNKIVNNSRHANKNANYSFINAQKEVNKHCQEKKFEDALADLKDAKQHSSSYIQGPILRRSIPMARPGRRSLQDNIRCYYRLSTMNHMRLKAHNSVHKRCRGSHSVSVCPHPGLQ